MKFINDAGYDLRKNRTLLFMIFPTVLYFFIFSYIPLAGIILAFENLDYQKGIFASPWVGLENFKFFFMSGQAFLVTRNTIFYNIVFIATGTILQLALAVFLSELGGKFFKKLTQGMMFLPYFISWVVVGTFVYNIFNFDFGVLNTLLRSLHIQPIDVNNTPDAWKYILVFFNSWKYAGYGSVIYLAAITNLDSQMYEAADIDGASIFQKVTHITLPSLVPTIIILTLLNIGNIFRGDFDMFYQLVGTNGLLYNATDVIDTFVFRSLMFTQEFGMAAASGLYQSVLCFIILNITNMLVRRVDKDYALY